MKRLVVKALQTMNQHWAVDLRQHVFSYLDSAVRSNADDVAIKRRMVQLAKR